MPPTRRRRSTKPAINRRSPSTGWQNRIIRQSLADPNTIATNDKNWRLHPDFQKKNLTGILDRIGWIQGVIVNQRTGKLIDGHLRLAAAIEKRAKQIPVTYVDLSEAEENDALLSYDLTGTLAKADAVQLRKLRDEVTTDNDFINSLGADADAQTNSLLAAVATQESVSRAVSRSISLQGKNGETGGGDGDDGLDSAADTLPGSADIKDELDYDFGSNAFDIPEINPKLCIPCPEPISTWVSPEQGIKTKFALTIIGNNNTRNLPWSRSVLCCHTEDHYLEPLWWEKKRYAIKLLNRGLHACISPEFSVGAGWSTAERIYNVYRNRLLACYWQSVGLPIIPSVSHLEDAADEEFLFLGVPKGLPCISVQVQANSGDTDADEVDDEIFYSRSLSRIVALLKPQSLLVYGSPNRERFIERAKLPRTLHVISIDNYSKVRYDFLHAKQKAAATNGKPVRRKGTRDS